MDIRIFETPEDTAVALARRVTLALADDPDIVLGLPTGRTPIAAYAELRRLHAAGDADFSRASTFNLDEFAGVGPSDPGSFRTFMDLRNAIAMRRRSTTSEASTCSYWGSAPTATSASTSRPTNCSRVRTA